MTIQVIGLVIMGIGLAILGVTCAVIGIRHGRALGHNTALRADAVRHSLDMKQVVDRHNETIKRYRQVVQNKNRDLEDARNEVDELIEKGDVPGARRVGGALRAWLAAPDESDAERELLSVPGSSEGTAAGGPHSDGHSGSTDSVSERAPTTEAVRPER